MKLVPVGNWRTIVPTPPHAEQSMGGSGWGGFSGLTTLLSMWPQPEHFQS